LLKLSEENDKEVRFTTIVQSYLDNHDFSDERITIIKNAFQNLIDHILCFESKSIVAYTKNISFSQFF
jgi:hypothetical protein